MGNLGEALKQAGIDPRMAELRVAHSKFINQGGTTAQIRAEADAIDRMSGMGQRAHADHSQDQVAQTRQQVEGGEAGTRSPLGHVINATPPSSNHDGRGPIKSADYGQPGDAASRRVPDRGGEGQLAVANLSQKATVLPVREPTMQQRLIAARNANVVAITILDRLKTSDGRPWGDVGAHELDGMARDGALAIAIKRRLGVLSNSQRFKPLRELIKADQFEVIYNKAKENADAV